MIKENKRPKLVWIIVIFMILSGLYTYYNTYALYNGTIRLPEGFEKSSGVLYYLKSTLVATSSIISALLLFYKKEVAKWLFLGILIYSILVTIYYFIFPHMPAQYQNIYIISKIIGFFLSILVTWYVFKLKEKGYYCR